MSGFVLGNCEYDEKGCADGDPRWEVVFSNMATGRGYPKPFIDQQWLIFGIRYCRYASLNNSYYGNREQSRMYIITPNSWVLHATLRWLT